VRGVERDPLPHHRVEQTTCGRVAHLRPHSRERGELSEMPADRGEREPSVVELVEDLLHDEIAKDPMETGRVGPDRCRELRGRLRARFEQVGDAELGRHIDELRGDEAVDQPHQAGAVVRGCIRQQRVRTTR